MHFAGYVRNGSPTITQTFYNTRTRMWLTFREIPTTRQVSYYFALINKNNNIEILLPYSVKLTTIDVSFLVLCDQFNSFGTDKQTVLRMYMT